MLTYIIGVTSDGGIEPDRLRSIWENYILINLIDIVSTDLNMPRSLKDSWN